jgi:hypothetical protein
LTGFTLCELLAHHSAVVKVLPASRGASYYTRDAPGVST